MIADNRITDVHEVLDPFDTWVADPDNPTVGSNGYFANSFFDFTNLDNLFYGKLTSVNFSENNIRPFKASSGEIYSYFLDVDHVTKP